MPDAIVGTIPIKHSVDFNGSLCINVPFKLPPARLTPALSLSYHSAAQDLSLVGQGWVLKGPALIERVPATIAQDGFRGSINYDKNDRFALNGQRLMKISANEYRFEIEQWSKIVAIGSNAANPDSWEEHLPDGTIRLYGKTPDSNIKAQGRAATRVWAISEYSDPFSNYISFSYTNNNANGSFYLNKISYGGNHSLNIQHQRVLSITYEARPDSRTQFVGGSKVSIDKRIKSISASIKGTHVWTYSLAYDQAPSTLRSRLRSLTLADSSGACVNPLRFDWSSGDPAVFDPMKTVASLSVQSQLIDILPIDVTASGRTDMVIATQAYDSNIHSTGLHLDVYLTDAKGNISTSPFQSSFTGLPYSDHCQILALDVSGNGRTDLVHVRRANSQYVISVLSSTSNGYQSQTGFQFQPEAMDGKFSVGDFQGDGCIGLLYAYKKSVRGHSVADFVQLVPNGSVFSALSPVQGPSDIPFDKLQVVVGDLSGNGAEDAFLLWPASSGGKKVARVGFLESQKGVLQYRSDNPLLDSAEAVLWNDYTVFFAHSVDDDGKTGLLALSRDTYGYLQFQVLRSTGPSLLPATAPQSTTVSYNGGVTLSRVLSSHSTDLINVFESRSGFQVNVLRFYKDTFSVVSNVRQPSGLPSKSSVRCADLRGVGRADCLFAKLDRHNTLTLYALPSSGTGPIDFLTGYANGLGATISVQYSPLTDPGTYTAHNDTPGSPVAFMSALVRGAPSATLSSSSGVAGPPSSRGRVQLVHFPMHIVKELSSCVSPSLRPRTRYQEKYTYQNAKIAYDGRGWLGFGTIAKEIQPNDIYISSSYMQVFPFIGQVSESKTCNTGNNGWPLKAEKYTWKAVSLNAGVNQWLSLPSIRENYYEAGKATYDVDVSRDYDSFGNVCKLTISAPKTGKPMFKVDTTYTNDEKRWVIGTKTQEIFDGGDGSFKKHKFSYIPGTQTENEVSVWASGAQWLTQSFEFDGAGNTVTVKGTRFLRSLSYDNTYSFPTLIFTHTGPGKDSEVLKESATHDWIHGLPASWTDANGHQTWCTRDVLGRILEVAEGDSPSARTVVEKQWFRSSSGDVACTHATRCSWDEDSWEEAIAHIDGLGRVWRTEQRRPDNPSTSIYGDAEYDGAGRIVKRSQNYFAGSDPVFRTYAYDTLSRPTSISEPAAVADAPPVVTSFAYSFKDGKTVIIETRSDGTTSSARGRELEHFPNPDASVHNTQYVKSREAASINETNDKVEIRYDGMGRLIHVVDPRGVQLSAEWDGLSRAISRQISSSKNAPISHFTFSYDASSGETVMRNELAGLDTTTKTDFMSRLISKTTRDESLSYTYDAGNAEGQLTSVLSSNGIEHHFDYDTCGNVITSSLSMDGKTYTTSYEWSPAGKLLRQTNPDRSTLVYSYFNNSTIVENVKLTDVTGKHQAYVNFGNFGDPFFRPLHCSFGNGLQESSSLARNGVPTHSVLASSGTTMYQQMWELDGRSRIQSYGHGPTLDAQNSFTYDAAGRLTNASGILNSSSTSTEAFAYDSSGNLILKGGKTFVNDGWQLSSILNSDDSTYRSFRYSPDGNLIAKLDGSSSMVSAMQYDAEGRLVKCDGVTFTYDYRGRLLKSIQMDGNTTWYPTESYDVSRSRSGGEICTSYVIYGGRRASLSSGDRGSSRAVLYYHTDHLNSVVAVSDSTGKVLTSYDYGPYGQVTIHGPDVSRYHFSGKESFGGLLYFGARFYDSEIGRFLTLDNAPLDVTNISPSTFNHYVFSGNDPVNYIDFNGNAPWWHFFVDLVAIVGGILLDVAGIEPVGTALISAGAGGLDYDLTTTIEHKPANDLIWGAGIGFDALLSLGGTAFSAATDTFLPSITGDVLSEAASTGMDKYSRVLIKGALPRLATGAAKGAVQGTVKQVTMNAIAHKPLSSDLGESAILGGIGGSIGGGVGVAGKGYNALRRVARGGKEIKWYENYGMRYIANVTTRGEMKGLKLGVDDLILQKNRKLKTAADSSAAFSLNFHGRHELNHRLRSYGESDGF